VDPETISEVTVELLEAVSHAHGHERFDLRLLDRRRIAGSEL
jgi:hypothetical protein